MPKKPGKNAFFYFMLDFKEKYERKGKRFPGGLQQVSQECAGLWQRLPQDEKNRYAERANRMKNNSTGGEKYTSQGVPLTAVAKEQKEKCDHKHYLKNTIEQIIHNAVASNNLELTTVSMIAINYFCETNDRTYTPAEVAIINFNLENGIIGTYHTLVNPLTLPLGMAFVAKNHSDETHKLPIPPQAEGETNYGKIFDDLYNFIYDDDINQLKPVLAREDDIKMIKSILEMFANEANKTMDIKIFPIHEFFYELKNTTAKLGQTKNEFPSIHLARAALERDVYEFHSDLACETHEEIDCSTHCSLSIIKRLAYTIADNCCLDLDINIMPGQHLPIDAKMPDFKFDTEYASFKEKQLDSIKKEDDEDETTVYNYSNSVISCHDYTDSDFSRLPRRGDQYFDAGSSTSHAALSSTIKTEPDGDGFIAVSKRKNPHSSPSSRFKRP